MILGIIQSQKKSSKPDGLKSKRFVVHTIILVMAVILLGLYLIYSWDKYRDNASSQAVKLALSLEVFLPHAYITELSRNCRNLDTPEYPILTDSLTRLIGEAGSIRSAYLIIDQGGNPPILLHSGPPGSLLQFPSTNIGEAGNAIYQSYLWSDQSIVTKPTIGRQGSWVSVRIPIKNAKTGDIIAVFGTDYLASVWNARLWKQMIPNIIIAICILILFLTLLYAWIQHARNKALINSLALSESLYRAVFNQAPIGIAIVNGMNFINESVFGHASVNPRFEQILGRTDPGLTNVAWADITHPDDLQADLDKYEQFRRNEINGYSMEKRFIRPDGSIVWVNMIVARLSGILNEKSLHLCLIDDITARKEAELSLNEIQRRQTVFLSQLPGLAYRCNYDRDWTMQFVSDGCYDLTGYPPDSLLNNRDLSYNDVISPEYREKLWDEWARVVSHREPFRYEYAITTATGEEKWVLEIGQAIYKDDGEVEALEGIVLDITDRKKMEDDLRYINEHDRLTGLYNGDYLARLLENDTREYASGNRALINIDLSMVQLLAAHYGFRYTQNLIKNAADLLSQYCTDERMLFRAYENRFIFYLKDYKDRDELINFSEEISKTLATIFAAERVGGGIGILEIDNDTELDLNSLSRRLEIASIRSISIFDGNFHPTFYDHNLQELADRERLIRQELSRIAADNNRRELFLLYQPILDLKTNSICGFEALARLNTDKLGLVSPVEFIPIAEKTKLIIPIGDEIIMDALRFLNRLERQGYDMIDVSINISAIQLLWPDFINRLSELINEIGVSPGNVTIEITESVFASDYDTINGIIIRLKDIGLHIAIDDFGTGYSSLAREKELRVDCLKIDKYFIDRLSMVESEKAITGDIISMAHRLGHCVIAEGVEKEEQKQYLIAHGCDKIQGYLIGKPLDEEAAIELLCRQAGFGESCNLNDE